MGFPGFFQSNCLNDPQWQIAGESLPRSGKVVWGYTGSAERRNSSDHSSTENPFISALFDPKGMVCVVTLVSD